MNKADYRKLLEQHTGPLPDFFADQFLTLARQHGGRQVLEELQQLSKLGWHPWDILYEAERAWPIPKIEAKQKLLDQSINQLKGALHEQHN